MDAESEQFDSLARRLNEWLDEADALAAGHAPTRPLHSSPAPPARLRCIKDVLDKRVAERSGLLHVLHDVTVIANQARTIDDAFRRILQRVARHSGWSFGHVYLVSRHDPNLLVRARAYFDRSPGQFARWARAVRPKRLHRGEGLPGRVLACAEAVWVSDLSEEPALGGAPPDADVGLTSAAAFPVKVDGEVHAVVEFFSDRVVAADRRANVLMADIGTHLGLFLVRKSMKRRIAELTTQEQRRIGRDLHDDLGQQLTGVALLAKSLERNLRCEGSAHAERAAEVANGLKEAQTHLRLLARGLAPVEIDARGLMKALNDLARTTSRRFEKDVRFVARVDTLVRDTGTATELYRIAQEAVTNAAKHGKATEITIELAASGDEIELDIVDNGTGLSDRALRRIGVGMSTMAYRAGVIGGELTIERAACGGTAVRCTVSNDDEAPDGEYADVG